MVLSSVCVRESRKKPLAKIEFHVTYGANFGCAEFVLLLLVIEAALEYEGNHFAN